MNSRHHTRPLASARVLVLAFALAAGVPSGGATAPRPDEDAAAATGASPENAPVARGDGSDWPVFLGPSGNNKSAERGIRTQWPEEGLPLRYVVKLGTGYGGPSIARGRLFIFDREGDRARLRCLESHTGEERWRYEYPTDYSDLYGYNNGPRTTPLVDGDRVYLFGAEGEIHCVSFDGGKRLWRVDTAERFGVVQNFFGVGSTPVVEGDLFIAHVGGSPPGSPGIHTGAVESAGSGVVAFDKRTGEVRYAIGDELASYASPQLATIDGRRWCFLFARGGLLAFEPRTGRIDFHYPWRAPTPESVNASNPVVFGEHVFISETYGPGSSLLRVRGGGAPEVVWKDPPGREKAMQTHWNTAVYHEGYLYGSSGRHPGDAELRCVEALTGKVVWSRRGLARATLLHVDGHFVCLGEYGELALVRATPERFHAVVEPMRPLDAAGRPRLRYPCWAPPVLSHGLLYLRGSDALVCFELIPSAAGGAAQSRPSGK